MAEAFAVQYPFMISQPLVAPPPSSSSKDTVLSLCSPLSSVISAAQSGILNMHPFSEGHAAGVSIASTSATSMAASAIASGMLLSEMTPTPANDCSATASAYPDLPRAFASASPMPELVQSARATHSPSHNTSTASFQCGGSPQMEQAMTELAATQAALATSTLPYTPVSQQLTASLGLPVSTEHAVPALSMDGRSQVLMPFGIPAKSLISALSQSQPAPTCAASNPFDRAGHSSTVAANSAMSGTSHADAVSPASGLDHALPASSHSSSSSSQLQPLAACRKHQQSPLFSLQNKFNLLLASSAFDVTTLPDAYPDVAMLPLPDERPISSLAASYGQLCGTMAASACLAQHGHGAIGGHPIAYGSAGLATNRQSRSPLVVTPTPLEGQLPMADCEPHMSAASLVGGTSASEPCPYRCQWRGCSLAFHDAALLMHHVSEEHIGRRSLGHLNLQCEWGDCRVSARKRDHIISHIRLHIPYWPLACKLCGRMFKRNPALKRHLRRHMEKPYSV